jgi:hypothetical protein
MPILKEICGNKDFNIYCDECSRYVYLRNFLITLVTLQNLQPINLSF